MSKRKSTIIDFFRRKQLVDSWSQVNSDNKTDQQVDSELSPLQPEPTSCYDPSSKAGISYSYSSVEAAGIGANG